MSILKHDIGEGLIDYYKDGELVGHDRGPNEQDDESIAELLNDTVINYEDSDEKKEQDALQWKQDRETEYAKKSPVEQIEMMADGTFNDWYAAIKLKYPKPP